MGNAQSELVNKVGYQVLMVQGGSPAAGILCSFWDVIIGSQQQIFDKEDSRLIDLFKSNIGKPISLLVYNLRTEKTREAIIIPSNTWGGNGLVGISIRFSSFEHTLELVWHILDVYMESPASEAKLHSRTDYIVGTPDQLFTDSEDFFLHVSTNMNKPVQYYVYNSLSDDVRLVTLTPNKDWGGAGSLGCDVGYGYLHRIPNSTSSSNQNSITNTPSSPIPPNIARPTAPVSPSMTNNALSSPSLITTINPNQTSILAPNNSLQFQGTNNVYSNEGVAYDPSSSPILNLNEQMEQVKL